MYKWNDRFELLLMSDLKDNSRERVNKAVTYRTPTQMFGQAVAVCQHSLNTGLNNHSRPAGWAGLGLVNSLVLLNHRGQDIFLLLQYVEDSGLVHWFIEHHQTVYPIGGSNGLPN